MENEIYKLNNQSYFFGVYTDLRVENKIWINVVTSKCNNSRIEKLPR